MISSPVASRVEAGSAAGLQSLPFQMAASPKGASGLAGAAPHASGAKGPTNRAPGQMWNPKDKILFPSLPPPPRRSAVVWVLGKDGKPESRQVVLGLTDGSYTEVVSGGLKPGDQVIVADEAQADVGAQSQLSLPFGGMMRGRGRGR
jgi:hypothetical protein